MRIGVGYELTYEVPQATPMLLTVNVHYSRASDLVVPDRLITNPPVPVSGYRDSFGNWITRIVAPAGRITLSGQGIVNDPGLADPFLPNARQHMVQDLPEDTLLFLLGSRYCETDRLAEIAWGLFNGTPMGWGRVQAICDFVNGHIRFDYQQARSTRSAFDAYRERVGVCRDFAHLAVAFCRCLNIPARYVNGHLGDIGVPVVDPMDFSAWIEVYLDGAWHTFDPRNNVRRIGRIVVARGRDAADIPLVNSFGPHVLKSFRVWTYEVDGAPQT